MKPYMSLSLVMLAAACGGDPTPTAPLLTSASPSLSGSATFISISSASLTGTALAITGSGAKGGAPITVNGARLGTASNAGAFAISSATFKSASCVITVSDGKTSAQPTLNPCSPSGGVAGANVPKPIAPAAGSSVTQPGTVSWSTPVTATPVDGYNWEISKNSAFTLVVFANSVNAPATTDVFSGLPSGTYYWRVQAVEHGSPASGQIVDPWSAPVAFTITGSGAGTPSTPTITFPASGAQYHPLEYFYPKWTASVNAASYDVEYSSDSIFTPVNSQFKRSHPAADSRDTIRFGNELTTWVRVRGVSATGVVGLPSIPVRMVITYRAPIGPAPVLVSPVTGTRGQLPITFTWRDVQNPQLEGYTLMISKDAKFTGDCGGVEFCNMLITGTSYSVTGFNGGARLPAGTHYWRVQSIQGSSGPFTPALTAWSAVGSFIVP